MKKEEPENAKGATAATCLKLYQESFGLSHKTFTWKKAVTKGRQDTDGYRGCSLK